MTKNSKTKLILILIICLAIAMMLVGCSGKKLATPELSFDGERGIVNWDSINNASKYLVTWNDKEVETDQPSFKLTDRGRYTIYVTAIAPDGKKFKNSDTASIDILYSTRLPEPEVELTRYYGGDIKYVIKNYDKFATGYMFTVGGKSYTVTEERGVIDTNLSDGDYEVNVIAKGDNVITRDSYSVKENVTIKPIQRYEATYETATHLVDFLFNTKVKNGEVTNVALDLYDIDSRSYSYEPINGMLSIHHNVLLNHATDGPATIEVSFKDGNMILVEVTIIDHRLVTLDDYISVFEGSPANIQFDIYKNKLLGIELVKKDATKTKLVADTDYEVTYSLLKANVLILQPNPDTDDKLIFTFEKDDNTYTREIKYYFKSDAPYVRDKHFTFNKANMSSDIVATFDNTNNSITEISAKHAVLNSDIFYDNKLGTITIKADYLKKFDEGAVINVRVGFGSEYDSFNIHIIDKDGLNVVAFTSSFVNYSNTSKDDLMLAFDPMERFTAISFDGKVLSTSNYSTGKTAIYLKSSFLKNVGVGRHEVRAHVDNSVNYDIVATVNITADSLVATNVNYTIDNAYPYIKISFRDMGDGVTSYVTNKRNNKIYNAVNGANYVLVPFEEWNNGDTFTVTHMKGGAKDTTEPISYKQPVLDKYEKYYRANFVWSGNNYDAVITSEAEFEAFIHYALMRVSAMRAYDADGYITAPDDTMLWQEGTVMNGKRHEYSVRVYIPYLNFDRNSFFDLINPLIEKFAGSNGTYKEPTGISKTIRFEANNECTIGLIVRSTNVPYVKDQKGHEVVETHYNTHYEETFASTTGAHKGLPIDKWEKSQSVYLSDELYYVIEDGVRPVPVKGSPAEAMYNKIIDIVTSICDDSMSEREKFTAMFEWIVDNVTYDHNTAKYVGGMSSLSPNYPTIYPRRCFYLEGVFYDKVAVCNGLSKALVVMAGIEGINSMKVVGGSTNGRHAWVKVRLDGIWYNSDPTWGSPQWTSEPTKAGLTAEGVNHLHTLVNDELFIKSGAHSPEARFNAVYANIDYNYFANMTYGITNGDLHSRVIDSVEDIKVFVNAHKDFIMKNNTFAFGYIAGALQSSFSVPTEFMTAIESATGYTYDKTEKTISNDRYEKNYILYIYRRK